MTNGTQCPWYPTQPDTSEHLLLHCPSHHSHRMALLHILSSLHFYRPTVNNLLGALKILAWPSKYSSTSGPSSRGRINSTGSNTLTHLQFALLGYQRLWRHSLHGPTKFPRQDKSQNMICLLVGPMPNSSVGRQIYGNVGMFQYKKKKIYINK